MPRLLIVANCPSPNTQRLMRAAVAGARSIADVQVTARRPLRAGPTDVLNTDAILLGTTENFGSMSGQIKDFLERIYYPCLNHTQSLPSALYIKAGLDGSGTEAGVQRILTGLKWKLVHPPLILKGPYQPDFPSQCKHLGTLIAAGLEAGIF